MWFCWGLLQTWWCFPWSTGGQAPDLATPHCPGPCPPRPRGRGSRGWPACTGWRPLWPADWWPAPRGGTGPGWWSPSRMSLRKSRPWRGCGPFSGTPASQPGGRDSPHSGGCWQPTPETRDKWLFTLIWSSFDGYSGAQCNSNKLLLSIQISF